MTKYFIIGSIMLTSSITFAQEARPVASPVISPLAYSNRTTDNPHHLISASTDGLGWSGLGSTFNWDENDSGIKSHKVSEGKLKLNYNYIFPSKFMLGLEVSSEASTVDIEDTSGDEATTKESEVQFGLTAGYNFNEDIFNSWWIKGSVGKGDYKSETKNSSGSSDVKYDYTYLRLSAGKRFSFDSLGLRNLSYSPSISAGNATFSGDAKDAGLKTTVQVRFDIIRFDILF